MQLREYTNGCDVLLVTVTEIETEAVHAALTAACGNCSPATVRGAFRSYLDFGIIGGAHVVHVRSEMGSDAPGGSVLTVSRAIDEVNPKAIIMVGIAFGVDPKKQPIGTILVSRQIEGYELQRVSTNKKTGEPVIVLRGDRVTASVRLLDLVEHGRITWKGPSVMIGKIISGQKLVDNHDFRCHLETIVDEVLGGDMEGQGLYVAAKDRVEWILIKSVCDWADGNKVKNKLARQKRAAKAAASFVAHILMQGGFRDPLKVEKPDDSLARVCIKHPLQRAKHFVGRVADMSELQRWWGEYNSAIRCQALLGFGGSGKTAIADVFVHWVQQEDRNAAIFVWSFYDNDNTEEMFRDFSEWRKLTNKYKNALLVLDGVERVQNPGTDNTLRGSILSKPLQLLIRKIVSGVDPCRALITSRYPLADFSNWKEESYHEERLEHLPNEDSMALLRKLGVRADDDELAQIVEQCGGHALTLTVWGSYICYYHDGIPRNLMNLDIKEAAGEMYEARVLNRCLAEHATMLTEGERAVMVQLAESAPVHKDRFSPIALKKLQQLGLISLAENDVSVVVHPALRDFFRLIRHVATDDILNVANKHTLELEEQPGFTEGECLRCGSPAMIESAYCDSCEESVDIPGEPDHIGHSDGHVVAYFSGHRGGMEALECPECESAELTYEFDHLCSYCEHVSSKDD